MFKYMDIQKIIQESINKVLKENSEREQYISDSINHDVEELDKMCQKFMQEQSDVNLGWLVWHCKNFIQKYNNI